jgi:hypothetical protein
MRFIMASAIERVCPPPVLAPQDEKTTLATPQRGKRPDKEVTSFACEVLRVYHGLREFSDVYSDDLLPQELIDNRHENTPRYERMQQGVNSLTGRVTKLAKVDPRIQTLFELMVKTAVKEDDGNEGLREIESMVHELIGNENIIPDHPFLKHGLVCVKDDFPLLDIKPENLITETDLIEMIELKGILLDSKSALVRIHGDESFITDTFNDFEKLLTLPEGRELAIKLVKINTELLINHDKRDRYTCATNSITLTKNHDLRYGHSTSGLARIMIPKYITLAHEVIHSLHSKAGEFKSHISCKNPELWTNQEEIDTIGHHQEIAGLTENAFIRGTFHLQRKYHAIPPALEPSHYSLDQSIEECKLLNQDDTLIDFIRTNKLTEAQISKIFLNYILIYDGSLKVVHELLNTPKGQQFFKESTNFTGIFEKAASKNDISMVERLFSQYPAESENIASKVKANLVLNSLSESLDLVKLFIDKNFHLKVKSELPNILKRIYYPSRRILSETKREMLKAVVKNKELLNISDEDLALFRKTPGLSAEIQQLLTS